MNLKLVCGSCFLLSQSAYKAILSNRSVFLQFSAQSDEKLFDFSTRLRPLFPSALPNFESAEWSLAPLDLNYIEIFCEVAIFGKSPNTFQKIII